MPRPVLGGTIPLDLAVGPALTSELNVFEKHELFPISIKKQMVKIDGFKIEFIIYPCNQKTLNVMSDGWSLNRLVVLTQEKNV